MGWMFILKYLIFVFFVFIGRGREEGSGGVGLVGI